MREKTVSATEFQRNIGERIYEAESGITVHMTSHGRPSAVLMGAREYDRLNELARKAEHYGGWVPDEEIERRVKEGVAIAMQKESERIIAQSTRMMRDQAALYRATEGMDNREAMRYLTESPPHEIIIHGSFAETAGATHGIKTDGAAYEMRDGEWRRVDDEEARNGS